MKRSKFELAMQQYLEFLSGVSSTSKMFVSFLETRQFRGVKNFGDGEDAEFSRMHKRVSAEIKQCYMNSQRAVLLSRGAWKYYEGWVLSDKIGLPIEHSWNVVNHRIRDLTLSKLTRNKPGQERLFYCGVNIPLDFVLEHQVKKKVFESLLRPYFASTPEGKFSAGERLKSTPNEDISPRRDR